MQQIKTLTKALPQLKTIENLPEGSKILNKARKKVKGQAGVEELINKQKKSFLEIVENKGVVEELDNLIEYLQKIVTEDGKDSVAYLNMKKTKKFTLSDP